MKTLFLGLILTVSAWAAPARALPKVEVAEINGFEVHFVDLGVGDQLSVSFAVNYGSLDDQFGMMGRAHLLEHLMFTGTKRFPGYKTLDQLLQPTGAIHNAHTSLHHTFYFLTIPQIHSELGINIYLSMLGDLEWDERTFSHERGVVINEIVEERIPAEGSALWQMPFLHLLQPQHPWARHAVFGDCQNLSCMSLADVRSLYQSHYVPGLVKVALLGNFSDPEYRKKIREWVEKYLQPQTQATARKRPVAPSLFSEIPDESGRRLLVHSENSKGGFILMEADSGFKPPNPLAMDVFTNYLNIMTPGSLLYDLIESKGWVDDGGFQSFALNERQFLYFTYNLSKDEANRTSDVELAVTQALSRLRHDGAPQEVFKLLKDEALASLRKTSKSSSKFLDVYEELLISGDSLEETLTELNGLTNLDLAHFASAFRPVRSLFAEYTADADGLNFDERFRRGFKVIRNTDQVNNLMHAFSILPESGFTPQLAAVDLGNFSVAPVEEFFVQSRTEANIPLRLVLDFRNDLSDAAAMVRLRTTENEPLPMIAAELIFAAAEARWAGELAYFKLRYHVDIIFEREGADFKIYAKGEDAFASRALSWVLEKLAEFQLTPEELVRLKSRIDRRLVEEYTSAFTAQLATAESQASMDPTAPTSIEQRKLLNEIGPARVNQLWRHSVGRTSKEILMVGAFTSDDGERIARALQRLSPKSLESIEMSLMTDGRGLTLPTGHLIKEQAPLRAGAGYGLTRVYQGPDLLNLEESAGFLALASVLGAKISAHNRSEQQLGYIHNAHPIVWDGRHYGLLLLGQTEGPDKAALTIEGWDHVLEKVRTGEVSDQDLQQGIDDMINTLSVKYTTASEILSREYERALSRRYNAKANEHVVRKLKETTPKDVRRIAERYLFRKGVQFHQLTLKPCESLLKGK